MFVAPQVDDVVVGLGAALGRARYEVIIVAPMPDGDLPVHLPLARRLEPLRVGDQDVEIYDGMLPGGHAEVFLARTDDVCGTALALALAYDRWPQVLHAFGAPTWRVLALATSTGDRPAPVTIASIGRLDPSGPDPSAFIARATALVAPSASYAAAVCTPDVGGDLAPALASARDRLRDVPNGLDTVRWNARFDPDIAARFGPDDQTGKAACKAALQEAADLPRRPDVPLIAIGGALASDAVRALVHSTDELGPVRAQLLFHGDGDDRDAAAASALATRHPTRIAVVRECDSRTQRRVAAGADFYLLPDDFDPTAPSQLRCARYGAVPMVGATSGLTDHLVDYDPKSGTGNAILFEDATAHALVSAIRRAERAFAGDEFSALVARVMAFDLSWSAVARQYAAMYDDLMSAR